MKRGPEGPSLSEVRKRLSDIGPTKADLSKSVPLLAGEGPKDMGDRAKAADLGRRLSETPGAKPAGPMATPKGGSSDGVSGEPIAKPGAVKPPLDRPDIKELRKRIPDVPGGKSTPSDGISKAKAKPFDGPGKPSGGVPGMPGKATLPREKLPDHLPQPHKPKLGDGTKPGMKIVSPSGMGEVRGKPGAEPVKTRFPDRVKRGDFEALTRGAVGQRLNLAEQYRLAQHGDVARRMAALKRPGRIWIAASGINTRADVLGMAAIGYNAVLVGTSIMREPDPGQALARLTGKAD